MYFREVAAWVGQSYLRLLLVVRVVFDIQLIVQWKWMVLTLTIVFLAFTCPEIDFALAKVVTGKGINFNLRLYGIAPFSYMVH